MAALAAAGALIVGGGAAAMVGTSNADPVLPVPAPVVGTTYVLPDLLPFKTLDTRAPGTAEVDDEFGAPTGGGEASLRLQTPDGTAKASIVSREDAGKPLAAFIPTAAYSAYQGAATVPVQFPSLQLEVDYNGLDTPGGFSTLGYEPVYNPTTDSTEAGVWHRYQAGAGRWCSTQPIPGVITEDERRCNATKPLSDFTTAQPNIVVTGVIINQGSGNPGLDAAVDLVSTPSTIYDFELTKPEVPTLPTTKPCEEPTTPAHPGGGEWGEDGHENGGHEDGGTNGGHEDQGHEKPDNGGHEQPSDGGHEQPDDQEQPDDGGHEPPACS
ncbi:hypothetical protein [Actinomycetospora succinea]|uniref:hypothetical protein n=1 Tax=Actinomycetospora succinea TaxID=663603 RepID=UPI0010621176|nr:hypothetical protein [Actinomycetospora succinea]